MSETKFGCGAPRRRAVRASAGLAGLPWTGLPGGRRPSFRLLRACLLGACLLGPGAALAQVPPGATPGGAAPDLPSEPLPVPLDEAAFPIPPSPERPFGVEDGDRIFVEEFVIDGVEESPELGVDPEALRALIEKVRIQSQGLDAVGPDGFTDEEREQVMLFFKRVVALQEFDDFLYEEYNDLVTKLREERLTRRAGLTIGQLQQVADQVTKYYRDKGFVLAQAFIPAQEVDEGKVTIEVVEGRLGNVLAQNNEGYSEAVLAAPFEDLIDAPVTNAGIESAILTLRDYPGLTPTAVFRPGALVGTSDLVVSVQDEKPYDVAVQLDNNGTRFTGERRMLVEANWNNPTGAGDLLRGELLQQWLPKRSLFYAAEYQRPIWPGTIGKARFTRNAFDVGAEQRNLNISGVLTEAELSVRHSVIRSRFQNVYSHLGWVRSNAEIKRNKTKINKDNLSYLDAGMSFDNIDTEHNGIDVGEIRLAYGLNRYLGGMDNDNVGRQPIPPSRRGNKGNFASNNFYVLRGKYTRLQNIDTNIDLLIRLEGQYSNSLLTSQLQYNFGGPNNVRAYPVSEYLRDTAIFGSFEWFWRAPFFAEEEAFDNLKWGDILKVSFFADYAAGTLNQPNAGDEQKVDIAGYGAGLHFELPGQFLARLQASHPISGRPVSDDRATHWWFDLRYTF